MPGATPGAAPAYVLVFLTLGAPERRRLRHRKRAAEQQPDPVAVTTCRATVVDVGEPFDREADARAWLRGADDGDLDAGLAVLNRALHAFRLVTADPGVNPVGRHGALVARLGYGPGEQVSDGQWTSAIELTEKTKRQSRTKVLAPQARLAAILGGRERALACEELILRARLDVDCDRYREAAFQVLVALDAALAEIAVDPTAPRLQSRLTDLSERRDAVADAAQLALARPLDEPNRNTVTETLNRLESILRARAVINA